MFRLSVSASRCSVAVVACVALLCVSTPEAQRGRATRAPAQPATRTEPAVYACPSPLGEGVKTKRLYCDVLTARDPAEGIVIPLPSRTGELILRFDLHNRHVYSEDLIKANRGYRHYTASIGVLTLNNDLLSRFAIQNEFRNAADLVERIAGDLSPGGLKAVAPTGTESISIAIDADVDTVSILGEKLSVIRPDAAVPDNFNAPGRPVALISNVTLTYRPAPARRPARGR